MSQRTNCFLELYNYLNRGTASEKYLSRSSFPLLLDIELTNHCNFSCRMCETGMLTSTRPRGYMTQEIFEQILEEATIHNTGLRFIRWGEPTLHPHWLEWMNKATSRGLRVHFNTNGSLLDSDAMHAIVSAGIQSIKFSFQGVDAVSYREMRGIDFFDELVSIIRQLKEIRGTAMHPFIQISTTVTTESPHQIETFRELALSIADYVNVGITNLQIVQPELLQGERQELVKRLQAKQSPLRRPTSCNEVFGKLSIDWDGIVTSCCSDNGRKMIVGNLTTQTLADIWRSPRQIAHQEWLSRNEFDAIPHCRSCYVSVPLQETGDHA